MDRVSGDHFYWVMLKQTFPTALMDTGFWCLWHQPGPKTTKASELVNSHIDGAPRCHAKKPAFPVGFMV